MPRQASSAPALARRDENAEATRRALLDAARRAFAARGYADTSLDDIVGPARLTKGALYHHFKNKAAIFEAVYVELSEGLAAKVSEAVAAAAGDAWTSVEVALASFLDASSEPSYARIVLRDAPVVLGERHGRELDQAIGLGLVRDLLGGLRDEGLLPPLPLTTLARVILAVTSEVVIAMAYADDPALARREGTQVVLALLEGLTLKAKARDKAKARRG